MIIPQGTFLPTTVLLPCSNNRTQSCDYHLNVTTTGSDENDKPYLLTKLYIGTSPNVQAIAVPSMPDMRDFAVTEAALNDLGYGSFKVTPTAMPTGEVRITIESLNNPNTLAGIEVSYDGATSDEKFCQENCKQSNVCDPSKTKCQYSLYRAYESNPGYSKISLESIVFAHGTRTAPAPIDTANLAAINQWLNNLPEAIGQPYQIRYEKETLYLWNAGSDVEPLRATFIVESANIVQGGTQTDTVETEFQKGECRACCPTACGANGQLPCNNGINYGCNPDLKPDLNGLCRPPCKAGTAWFNGELVAAGGFAQPADCNGNCQAGLVSTAYGCRPAAQSNKVCDLDFHTTINKSATFDGIKLCNQGTFKPPTPILYGDGTAISTWINDPKTGICPDSQPCVTVTATPTATPNVFTYHLLFSGVNFDCSNTSNPLLTTFDFCETEISSCIAPVCLQIDLSPDCPVGQTWNSVWLRCISPDKACNVGTNGLTFGARRCQVGGIPTPTPEYELERSNKINAKVAEITQNAALNKVVRDWFAERKLDVDYTSYAINKLCDIGGAAGLPEWERICFYTPDNKLVNL
jgi:hypothetical protein